LTKESIEWLWLIKTVKLIELMAESIELASEEIEAFELTEESIEGIL